MKKSRSKLWRKYNKNENKYNIKKTTFLKIIKKNGEFKKAKKRTDLCNICCAAKQAKKIINEYIHRTNDTIENNMDIIEEIDDMENVSEKQLGTINEALQMSAELSHFEKKLTNNKIDYLSLFLSHFEEYKSNEQQFLNAIQNLKKHQCIMSIDYKEKIPVGHKKNEENYVFRSLNLRNCLGIILDFEDEEIVFDVITNITNQTGLLSKCILSEVINHPIVSEKFKSMGITEFDLWCDAGTHFKNTAMSHLCFHSLPNFCECLERIGFHFHTGTDESIYLFAAQDSDVWFTQEAMVKQKLMVILVLLVAQ